MASVLAEKALGAPSEQPLPASDPAWHLHRPAEKIDNKDENTPDNWVPRNERLLRLTGRHPLNCEPRMEDLIGAGFITPVSLHLVRPS